MSLSRGILDALLPPGSIWAPEDGAGFDQLLDGLADSDETITEFLAGLARLRSPELTPILSDLEREYGITPDDTISEVIRRARLLALKTAGNSDGSAPRLEAWLRSVGFDVYVHINAPAVDPALFLEAAPTAVMSNPDAIFNGVGVQFGGGRGILLVNGPIYYNQALVNYLAPTDSGYWPMVFFIGGPATRDPITGALTAIEQAVIPIERKAEFIRMIIQYKPMFSWCGLVAKFATIIEPDENSFGAVSILFANEHWGFADGD